MGLSTVVLVSALLLLTFRLSQAQSTTVPAIPRPTNASYVNITETSAGAGGPILPGFIGFSIEFSSFPDFAGNLSTPNTFSDNLLNNLGDIQGTKPYIRVGGNTQDFALFNSSQEEALIGIVVPAKSADYPSIITIGPSYFESYQTWPGARFIHGFNLGKNGSDAIASRLATVPYVCKALEGGRLLHWQLGNEPDLFKTSSVRPSNWTEQDYVNEWLNGTRGIREVMQQTCPDLASDDNYTYYAPSFAGTNNSLDPIVTWQDGLDADNDIAFIDSHNYINGADVPGVTLQGTLMNHTSTVTSIAKQLNESRLLAEYNLPYILGETNSLYHQGAPGLSNSFGAALWGVDFNLWCAANNISRVHMHQGTNYRYASWQPIDTNITVKGTKAPYYGNIAVANMLQNATEADVQIKNLPLPSEREAAYAAYVNGTLTRVMVINMEAYNYTDGASNSTRPQRLYSFSAPTSCAPGGFLNRLIANGSDAISGITFGGYSYNYELDEGRPVFLGNASRSEVVYVGEDGIFNVQVPVSSAAMINLQC